MAKRKKATNPQGEEVAKTEAVKTAKVKTVKVEAPKPKALKEGNTFLMYVDGTEQYLTRSVIEVMLKRSSAQVEIPKGSPFTPPVNSKCINCG